MPEPWRNGPLLGFDLETTGIDPLEALPVSFALVYFDAGKVQRTRYGLINPGVPIPPLTTKIHHLTSEMVKERGGDLEKSVVGIAGELLAASFAGTPVVGFNVTYDLTLLDACLRRCAKGEGLAQMGWVGPVVDPLVCDRHCDQYRKGSRKLTDLCTHYGVRLANAHNAVADAEAAIRVALAVANAHPEVGDADPDTLFQLQKAWRRTWATEFSEYRVKKGEAALDEAEGDFPIRRGSAR